MAAADVASTRMGPDTLDGIAPADDWQQWWQQQIQARRAATPWLRNEAKA